jgi:uncharacterized protein YuzE
LKLAYDREADALYIRLLEGEYQCRGVRLTDDIALDFAAGEQFVGIEVLGASRLFEKPEAPEIELTDLLPRGASAQV